MFLLSFYHILATPFTFEWNPINIIYKSGVLLRYLLRVPPIFGNFQWGGISRQIGRTFWDRTSRTGGL